MIFKVVNGAWDDGTMANITVTLTGHEGDTLRLSENQIPAVGNKPLDPFKAGSWDVAPDTETAITADTTYTYTYAFRNEISRTVIFKVVNGAWDDGTSEDRKVVLTGREGDTLKLSENQIPAVGSKPNNGYQAGSWDVVPSTETAITDPTTYTYTYVALDTPVVYYDESEQNQDYRQKSGGSLKFIFKRNQDDGETFSRFGTAQVDGRALTPGTDYEAAAGSLILTLKGAFLDTLAVGEHTLTVQFTDGTAESRFKVSKALDLSNFYDVAVPSDTFTFKKVWEGDSERSIDFTLYKIDDSVYHHGFDKRIVSDKEWKYNAWFSSPAACYVIEQPVPGYITRYENVGIYEQVTDRCCDGGTIINKKIPKTGDEAPLLLWVGCVLAGMAGITATLVIGRRQKRKNEVNN